MFRLIKQVQPTWVIGENVAHFTKMAFFRTKTDLESEDYRLQPFIIPACAIGAPHKRDRLWLIAHAQSKRCDRRREDGHSEISKRQVCTDQQDHKISKTFGAKLPQMLNCAALLPTVTASDAAQGAIIGKKDPHFI